MKIKSKNNNLEKLAREVEQKYIKKDIKKKKKMKVSGSSVKNIQQLILKNK